MYSARRHGSRYEHAARRLALRRLLAAGALVAGTAAISSEATALAGSPSDDSAATTDIASDDMPPISEES